MDLTMVEFNNLFKKYMTEVKILEKTHPRDSINLWIKICQFIVGFAKNPNCPRNLKPKLISQADSIIVKVKHMQQGNISSVFGTESQKPAPPMSTRSDIIYSSNEQHSEDSDHKAAEDDMFSKLNSLPDIPLDTEIESPPPVVPDDDTQISPSTPPELSLPQDPQDKADSAPTSPTSNVESKNEGDIDISTLAKLEAELKQMPSIFTEVKPTSFESKDTLVKVDGDKIEHDLDYYKKDTINLDQTSDVVKSDSAPDLPKQTNAEPKGNLRIAGFSSDPFKQAPKNQDVRDPFGSAGLNININQNSNKRVCFACGSSLGPNQTICPQCGTDNT